MHPESRTGRRIVSGGSAVGTVIASGDSQIVISGGSIWSAVLFLGGIQILRDGAEVYGETISCRGSQVISSGGSATGGLIVSGLAQGTLVCSSSRMNVLTGGTAFCAESEAGSLLAVYSGAKAADVSAAGQVWLATGASLG